MVINFSYLFPELSLFSSYCVLVSVMALLRIRILSDDLNQECLMQELLTGFWAGFRNKQGVPRYLETCRGKKAISIQSLIGREIECCWNPVKTGPVGKGPLPRELYVQRDVCRCVPLPAMWCQRREEIVYSRSSSSAALGSPAWDPPWASGSGEVIHTESRWWELGD